MAITYGFFNAVKLSDGTYDRTYNADQMSSYFEGLVSDGVYEDVGGALQVVAGSGMEIQVKSGRALIGSKWLKNDAAYSITLNASHVTLNRYTAVVARLDMSAREITIEAKDGEDATTPAKPAMTNSSTVKELCLAYIYVGRGATEITQPAIEDTRADTNICGWVTGLIKQVDTSQLFLQWQTAYEEFYQKWTGDFEAWFTSLTEELNVNTYIEQYTNVVNTETETSEAAIGISGYDPETDVLFANINGVALVENEDYTISGTGPGAKMLLTKPVEGSNTLEFRVLKSRIGQK